MSKKSTNSEVVVILLAMLRHIPKHSKTTAKKVQASLLDEGIVKDIRTVQRLLNVLCEHYEIEQDVSSKPYGYQWKKNAKGIGLPSLTKQQSLLLLLAKEHLQYLLPSNILKEFTSFFDEAWYQIQHGENNHLEAEWLQKICVAPTTQPLLPPGIDLEVLEEVSNALYQNHLLRIEYLNQTGGRHEANVMPLGLAQQGSRLYLVVRYLEYTDERNLALHRIQSARMLPQKFEQPNDFKLSDYLHRGNFGFSKNRLIQLQFSISKEAGFHLTETPLSVDQMALEETEQHYRFQATVYESEMLDWWLATFQENVWDIEKIIIQSEMNCDL